MNLYKKTNRFMTDYILLKKKLKRKPSVVELSEFDQLHYNGIISVSYAIQKLKINKNSKVLDIGSGLGGPARYIASLTNANISAIELQKELNDTAFYITTELQLDNRIKHLQKDILKYNLTKNYYNMVVSWLALYHIPNRTLLFKNIYNCLKQEGFFYSEDFYLKKTLNKKDNITLSKLFHANYLVSYENYLKDLEKRNFKIIEHFDLSEEWLLFTTKRLLSFEANLDAFIKRHGQETSDNVHSFFKLAKRLLEEETLGGIRFIAIK